MRPAGGARRGRGGWAAGPASSGQRTISVRVRVRVRVRAAHDLGRLAAALAALAALGLHAVVRLDGGLDGDAEARGARRLRGIEGCGVSRLPCGSRGESHSSRGGRSTTAGGLAAGAQPHRRRGSIRRGLGRASRVICEKACPGLRATACRISGVEGGVVAHLQQQAQAQGQARARARAQGQTLARARAQARPQAQALPPPARRLPPPRPRAPTPTVRPARPSCRWCPGHALLAAP